MLKQITLALGLSLMAETAQAHSEGHGTIEPEQALVLTVSAANFLTINKVDKDWSPLPDHWKNLPKSAASIVAAVDGDYVVAVINQETDETLYILVAGDGGIVDANFTGSFPYVWDLQTQGAETDNY